MIVEDRPCGRAGVPYRVRQGDGCAEHRLTHRGAPFGRRGKHRCSIVDAYHALFAVNTRKQVSHSRSCKRMQHKRTEGVASAHSAASKKAAAQSRRPCPHRERIIRRRGHSAIRCSGRSHDQAGADPRANVTQKNIGAGDMRADGGTDVPHRGDVLLGPRRQSIKAPLAVAQAKARRGIVCRRQA